MLCVFYRKYYVNCLDMTCNIDNFAAGKMVSGGLRLPNEKGTR